MQECLNSIERSSEALTVQYASKSLWKFMYEDQRKSSEVLGIQAMDMALRTKS